jgi:hypothetical protein
VARIPTKGLQDDEIQRALQSSMREVGGSFLGKAAPKVPSQSRLRRRRTPATADDTKNKPKNAAQTPLAIRPENSLLAAHDGRPPNDIQLEKWRSQPEVHTARSQRGRRLPEDPHRGRTR